MFRRLEQNSRHYYYSVIPMHRCGLAWFMYMSTRMYGGQQLSKSQIAAKLLLHTFKRSYLAPLLKLMTSFQKLKPNYPIAVTYSGQHGKRRDYQRAVFHSLPGQNL